MALLQNSIKTKLITQDAAEFLVNCLNANLNMVLVSDTDNHLKLAEALQAVVKSSLIVNLDETPSSSDIKAVIYLHKTQDLKNIQNLSSKLKDAHVLITIDKHEVLSIIDVSRDKWGIIYFVPSLINLRTILAIAALVGVAVFTGGVGFIGEAPIVGGGIASLLAAVAAGGISGLLRNRAGLTKTNFIPNFQDSLDNASKENTPLEQTGEGEPLGGLNSETSKEKELINLSTSEELETDDIRVSAPKPVKPITPSSSVDVDESPKIDDILTPKPATDEEIFLEDDEEAESAPEEIVLEACQETQFTAFYPRHVNAKQDYMLLLYAHLPDALIQADAEQFKAELGGRVPKAVVADETACLKEGALLTVMIHCDKLKFNQVGAMQQWKAPQTRFDFHFSADESLVDEILERRIAILLGMIEIASIDFQISVGASLEKTEGEASGLVSLQPSVSVPPYQKIFVSYSRKDSIVAEQYRAAQTMLGNTIFMDIHSIRAGEDWEEALKRFISEADVFQLFWSEHSASSEHVRFEWEYALKQRCPETACKQFIRPSYWQKPMPNVPQALGHLHFAYVELAQNSPEK